MAIALACLGMSIPVITAIVLVRAQAVRAENQFILRYAQNLLERADQTADQLTFALGPINRLSPEQACSADGLDLMRKLALGSTALQAVGYTDGDVMLCSSFGGVRSFPLGETNVVTKLGTHVRTHLELFGKAKYLAVVDRHAVGIVNIDLPLSYIEQEPNLTVAIFSRKYKKTLLVRGKFEQRWIAGDLPSQIVMRDRGNLIAIARSSRYDLGAVAVVPASRTAGLAWQAGLILIPIGLLTGLIFAWAMVAIVRSRFSFRYLLLAGLKRREFYLVYQPIVDLATGTTLGAEALLRWRRRNGESIAPDIFIPAAEEANVIRLLTARVFDLLRGDVGPWSTLSPSFQFAINLSAADLHTPETVDALHRLVNGSNLSFRNIIVETTERSFVDTDRARTVIDRIRALGIEIAIDDFGTGYSS
ncbi:MAG: hypothetical protein JWR77_2176, partial [Rhizorhabdus sp.]|nr:hypothetical protein [Rhizorhabdus sp.]